MKEVKKLAGQTLVYGLGTIVPRFLHYAVLTPFYTRIFTDTRDYGVVTELYSWMAVLLVVLTYGMETGYFRFVQNRGESEKVYSAALMSLFVTSVFFIALVNVFIRPVSAAMNYGDNHDYIRMFAVIVAVDAFTAIPFARLRKENRPLLFSIIKIANVIITIGLVVFLLKIAPVIYENSTGWFREFYNPDYKVGYIFAANLVSSLVTMVMLMPVILKARFPFDTSLWKRVFTYSLPLLLAGLSGSVNDTVDKILLRRMIGPEEGLAVLGRYGAACKIAVLMALFIQMYRFAAEPFFFERANQRDARQAYAFVMKYFIIVMLIIFLGINLYISVFQYIIGANYRDALAVVPIISMGYLLYGIYINHSVWYKINDLTRYAVYITITGTAITIVINCLFIPVFGYMASAWAHVVSYGTMIVFSFLFARKHYRVNYEMGKMIPYFIIAIAFTIFANCIKYKNLAFELAVNTLLILAFIGYAQYRDGFLTLIFSRNENRNNK
ncbi:MAG: oligosaccharide flippase family protein [Bacteroidales bacterium]|nr:oligosaccharide flippase family protein [Bacteroidales bacterium]